MNTLLRSRVAVASVIVAASFLILTGSMWYASGYLAQRMATQQAVERAAGWHNQIIGLLDKGAETFVTGVVTEADRRALETFIKASDSYRYVLFDRAGRAFWSSKKAKIGKVVEGTYFKTIISVGGTYVKNARKPASEIDNFRFEGTRVTRNTERDVTEIYLPVMKDGAFVGAIEHYLDVTDLIRWYRQQIMLIVVVVGIAGTIMTALIIVQLVYYSRKQEALLREAHERETRALQEDNRRSKEAQLLSELNDWLQSCKSLEELYDMVSAFLSKLLPACSGSIYIYSNSRDVLDGACSWNDGRLRDNIQADDCWGLRRGRVYAYGANQIDFVCNHMDGAVHRPYCCIPIVAHGETVGLLHFESRCDTLGEGNAACSDQEWEEQKRLAVVCSEQISLAIANVRLRDQLRDQSIRDPLTGLYNRRYLLEASRREVARAQRRGEPLAVLSLDVDHFKKFNDNHGHDAGDMVLRAVGDLLLGEFRDEDVPCRFGGEEFVLLLPGADAEAAARRAEQLRVMVEQITIRYGQATLPHISVSIGVAVFPDCGTTPQDLISSADRALYRAKAQGRNCVVMAAELEAGDRAKQSDVSQSPHASVSTRPEGETPHVAPALAAVNGELS